MGLRLIAKLEIEWKKQPIFMRVGKRDKWLGGIFDYFFGSGNTSDGGEENFHEKEGNDGEHVTSLNSSNFS